MILARVHRHQLRLATGPAEVTETADILHILQIQKNVSSNTPSMEGGLAQVPHISAEHSIATNNVRIAA